MSDDKKPPIDTEEHWEWVRKRAEARAKQRENLSGEGFDDAGLIAGGDEALSSTDAEAFPDELEEYAPSDRKPRLVKPSKD
jgi:hypothetical protein